MNERLRVIGEGDCKAKAGHYRAVVIIDSEIYQIGEDVTELEAAQLMCYAMPIGSLVMVYNERGGECFSQESA